MKGKIWLETCLSWYWKEESIWLGIGGFKHHKDCKWKGFSLHFMFFKHVIVLNAVSDYKAYLERMNRRYIPRSKN